MVAFSDFVSICVRAHGTKRFLGGCAWGWHGGLAAGQVCMDTSVITAASALAGAAIGGFTSLVAAWLSHRVQAKAERLAHDQLRRQELYKEFIEQASE